MNLRPPAKFCDPSGIGHGQANFVSSLQLAVDRRRETVPRNNPVYGSGSGQGNGSPELTRAFSPQNYASLTQGFARGLT